MDSRPRTRAAKAPATPTQAVPQRTSYGSCARGSFPGLFDPHPPPHTNTHTQTQKQAHTHAHNTPPHRHPSRNPRSLPRRGRHTSRTRNQKHSLAGGDQALAHRCRGWRRLSLGEYGIEIKLPAQAIYKRAHGHSLVLLTTQVHPKVLTLNAHAPVCSIVFECVSVFFLGLSADGARVSSATTEPGDKTQKPSPLANVLCTC